MRGKAAIVAVVLFVVPSIILPVKGEIERPGLVRSLSASPGIAIEMSTFFGGSREDMASNVHYDSDGNIIIVGSTLSSDLPVSNAMQSIYGGGRDAFILKLDSSYNVVFCTYYGGDGEEYAEAVVTDDENNIYISGHTESGNLTVLNALQTEMEGEGDAFVAKLSPTGSLVFGTYVGGNGGDEWITSMVLDEDGNMIMAGPFDSDNMNITTGVFQENYGGGSRDIVLLSMTPDGQSYVFMTYFGLDDSENCGGLALDSQGNIVMAGYSINGGITTEGAYQEAYAGGTGDVIVAKLSPNGQTLLWSTLLGGSEWDFGGDVNVDSDDNVIVSGYSESPDFPLQNEIHGNEDERDTFLAKLSEDGSSLLFSTLLGGDGEDRCYGMTMLDNGSVAVNCFTRSDNMPTVNPWQENNSGGYDAFFALYDSDLASLVSASYIGGSLDDHGLSLDTFNDEVAALVGYTHSDDFQTNEPLQSERGGGRDAFLVVLNLIPPGTTVTTTPPPNLVSIELLIIAGAAVAGIALAALAYVYSKKRS
ncbi:MAG: hypothetical protein JSW61_08550 [Candidatus Thorarchaeota archaeon]|nr:MAG: hypothetical protein JSW61_08550 [Candidatus Thorarchaeota archaeon]